MSNDIQLSELKRFYIASPLFLALAACASSGASSAASAGGGSTDSGGGNGSAGAIASGGSNSTDTAGSAGVSASGSAGSGGSGGGGEGGNASGAGGAETSHGGSGGIGSGGSGGLVSADAGRGGTSVGSGGSAGVGGASSQGPFTCTEVLGLGLTDEWWIAGFLSDGVDATKFQLKWHHQGYVGAWADPSSPFWSNVGDSQDPAGGSAIQAPCTKDSLTPDRVLYVAVDFELLTKDAWVAALNQAVATIKSKYAPSLKWIDITTLVRCPGDMMCNPKEAYGPGANLNVPAEDCYVPPYVDAAIAEVVAASPDSVGIGPEPQATMCDSPINGPHLSTASNSAAAKAYAAYFAQHP
jgi:hypothetical protein